MSSRTCRVDPSEWYGRLQRAYMLRADESLLDELTDIGRLMAVTGFPVESVAEAHGEILADELGRADRRATARLARSASVCLSELLVAWRIAAEGIGCLDGSGDDSRQAPCFLWFDPGGQLVSAEDGPSVDLGGVLTAESLDGLLSSLSAGGKMADIKAAIESRRLWSFEFQPPDSERRLRMVICPFRDGSGVVGIHDVTARHVAAESDFQRRKLASLGQLAGGIAHEINNFLQPILSTAQFISEDYRADSDLSADIMVILDSARAAAKVVRGILAFARRPSPTLTPLQLDGAVERELTAIRKTIPATITLVSELGGCSETAIGGGLAELGQVLRNLIDNAVDAVGTSGTITVTCHDADIAESEAVRIQIPAGRYLRLTVADDGCGMDATTASRIFDPFFTTKEIGKGTGLGLAIVRSIIQSWGGQIVCRRADGRGTAFDIFLRVAEGFVRTPSRMPLRSRQVRAQHGQLSVRVVVVDDDARVRISLARALARAGHTVREFDSAQTALAAMVEGEADVLITDLFMPDLDGLAFVREIRQAMPSLMVIVLTGGGSGEIEIDNLTRDTMESGAHSLLFKPVSTDVLLGVIHECAVTIFKEKTNSISKADVFPQRKMGD